jgi:SAM-dependent methyltransferase
MTTDPLFTLHTGLLREGPGSDETTLRALQSTGLSGAIAVADMGSGPGAASLLLAQALPGSRITAVDLHQPYLNALMARAHAIGVEGQIETAKADMGDAGFAPASLDLIWCEAALYFLGTLNGLQQWAPLLKSGGRIVFSEVVWHSDSPPDEAKLAFMEYPDMTSATGVAQRIEAAGFRLIDSFAQPDSDWDNYFGPLGARAAALRPDADAALREVLDGADEEASLFARHSNAYGYRMFITEIAA